MTGVDSTVHVCPGCGVKVIGHKTCGDPTRPGCAAAATAVTEEAVEKAAKALFVEENGDFVQPRHPWLTTFERTSRAKYTRRARAALEAAEPHLQPQVTQAQIEKVIDLRYVSNPATRATIADAVLALLETGVTK